MIETSSGAILFRKEKSTILYLLLHYSAGHWDFPKGKMEKGETKQQTAEREIKEETGITDLTFLPGFKEDIRYFFRREGETVAKTVYFFLAETKQSEVTISPEHVGFQWLPYDATLKTLTFKNSKEALKNANDFLTTRNLIF